MLLSFLYLLVQTSKFSDEIESIHEDNEPLVGVAFSAVAALASAPVVDRVAKFADAAV
jgi:hypothetical protein